MNAKETTNLLAKNFSHIPTQSQNEALKKIAEFLVTKDTEIFILKGYAGTGKTTLIQSIIKSKEKLKKKIILLAPTGRASKILGNYTDSQAYTIHKHIYNTYIDKKGKIDFSRKENKCTHTIFIVDEASMISDTTSASSLFKTGSMLDDIMEYVFEGTQCKLIFIGDTAQLPPVKSNDSPALETSTFNLFEKNVMDSILDNVVRQKEESGILHNATLLKDALIHNYNFLFDLCDINDVQRLLWNNEVEENIDNAYRQSDISNVIVIVNSNKRANLYNKQIRHKILDYDKELTIGEYLMVVKNNYFWLDAKSEIGFIANGDIIQIKEIHRYIKLYGFQFAEVSIQMIDYKDQQKPFRTIIFLDLLSSIEMPSLPYESQQQLYQTILKDYPEITSKYQKMIKAKNSPYFNALQVKYAYAITCHKSQGGQWDTVFVEKPYLPPDSNNQQALRWLYTAMTRAKKKVFLIGFKDEDFIL